VRTDEDRSPSQHYSTSVRGQDYLDLYQWALGAHENDPALKVRFSTHFVRDVSVTDWPQDFIPNLKDHLLSRILHRSYEEEPPTFTDDDRSTVFISGDRLEQRYTMTVNYTTYDLRRGQDKINMKGRPYIMALSRDPFHPYVYARVLAIYRVKVLHHSMTHPTNMDVLWVRWFKIDRRHKAGWKAKRLYKIRFVPNPDEGAFGFIDPNDIIRGIHLIPGFVDGLVKSSPEDAKSKWDYVPTRNWCSYYVNQYAAHTSYVWMLTVVTPTRVVRFVDSDMFMRYRGSGIGHKYMRAIEEIYENMSRERIHHKERKRKDAPSDNDAMDVDDESASDGEHEPEVPAQTEAPSGGGGDGGGDGSDGDEGGRTDESDEDEEGDGDFISGSDLDSAEVSESDDVESEGGYEGETLGF